MQIQGPHNTRSQKTNPKQKQTGGQAALTLSGKMTNQTPEQGSRAEPDWS